MAISFATTNPNYATDVVPAAAQDHADAKHELAVMRTKSAVVSAFAGRDFPPMPLVRVKIGIKNPLPSCPIK